MLRSVLLIEPLGSIFMTLHASLLNHTWSYIYCAPWRLRRLDFHQLVSDQLCWTRSLSTKKRPNLQAFFIRYILED